ncbi:hypothetical protein EMIT036CA2_40067 [Chryseobacterium sp. IT-36CA2]
MTEKKRNYKKYDCEELYNSFENCARFFIGKYSNTRAEKGFPSSREEN